AGGIRCRNWYRGRHRVNTLPRDPALWHQAHRPTDFCHSRVASYWSGPARQLHSGAASNQSGSDGGATLRVTHGSRRATTKDENGPRHLCFVFNAIGSYFHRSNSWLSESHNEG